MNIFYNLDEMQKRKNDSTLVSIVFNFVCKVDVKSFQIFIEPE